MANYCEFWLEMRASDKSFRVVLAAPSEFDFPDYFTLGDVQTLLPEKKIYVSLWFSSIIPAKGLLLDAAQFYNNRSIKFLLFMEIRKPLKPDSN
ncbi:MAG: hypothetical protein ACFFAN_00950 [Promethearchaeota archaeon]